MKGAYQRIMVAQIYEELCEELAKRGSNYQEGDTALLRRVATALHYLGMVEHSAATKH